MPNTFDPDRRTEKLRRPEPNVIDQRQQQIDPAGRNRVDPNARPDENRKQPGGSVRDGRRITKDRQT